MFGSNLHNRIDDVVHTNIPTESHEQGPGIEPGSRVLRGVGPTAEHSVIRCATMLSVIHSGRFRACQPEPRRSLAGLLIRPPRDAAHDRGYSCRSLYGGHRAPVQRCTFLRCRPAAHGCCGADAGNQAKRLEDGGDSATRPPLWRSTRPPQPITAAATHPAADRLHSDARRQFQRFGHLTVMLGELVIELGSLRFQASRLPRCSTRLPCH